MSQSMKSPTPEQAAWKTYLTPKIGGVVAAVVLVGGLAFFGLRANNQQADLDEISDEEMLVGFQKQSLGAMGVSDSASPSTGKEPPLEFPAAQDLKFNEAASPGPLFSGSPTGIEMPAAKSDAVTAASFERPLGVPSNSSPIRTSPVTPRVVANQPVWLTGTIETTTEK